MPQNNDETTISSSIDFSKKLKIERSVIVTTSVYSQDAITYDSLYSQLDKLIKLSNLFIHKNEKIIFTKQLIEIINYVGKLNDVDTREVYPTSQTTGLENITREDEAKPSLSQEEALSNIPLRQGFEGQAKSKHNGLFKVKAILEE